jgi:hypothetical protein
MKSLALRLVAGSAAFLTFILSSCAGPPLGLAPPSGPTGRVTYGGEPLTGAFVTVYASLANYRSGEEAATFGPTPASGDFTFALPPGRYYVTAAGRSPVDGRALFCFYGNNPVSVAPGRTAPLRLALALLPPPPRYIDDREEAGAGLAGTVNHGGIPLEGATVMLYLDDDRDFKGIAYAVSPPTDKEGRFALFGLLDTEYYVVVRKRAGGRLAGPLAPGDYYGFYPHNPLRLERGRNAEIAIEVIAKAEEAKGGALLSTTRIEGRIVDQDGRPLPGLYAFVYPDRIMSHAKPLAISAPTGPEGRFTISLEKGGTFYLGARERYGINPQPGEYYGKYTGSADHSIEIEGGRVRKGATIVVDRILE